MPASATPELTSSARRPATSPPQVPPTAPAPGGELAAELEQLIAKATDEDLSDDGRYFGESFTDLTKCSHGETGEYECADNGPLVEFLWNHRRDFLALLRGGAA